MKRSAIFALLLMALTPCALAVHTDEILSNPQLEARARELSSELRCMVCQNQSIDDSDAPLARDLRVLVRERLVAGDSDAQVRSFLVTRYGDFVLLKPPVKFETYALWAAPVLALGLGLALIIVSFKRRQAISPPLSDDERRELSSLREQKTPSENL